MGTTLTVSMVTAWWAGPCRTRESLGRQVFCYLRLHNLVSIAIAVECKLPGSGAWSVARSWGGPEKRAARFHGESWRPECWFTPRTVGGRVVSMAVLFVRVGTAEVELKVSGVGANEIGNMWYPWLQREVLSPWV